MQSVPPPPLGISDYSEPAYKKLIFEHQSILFLIQECYLQKQPEMFLNLTDKKLFDTQDFYFQV